MFAGASSYRWTIPDLAKSLHAREHFTVNVAVSQSFSPLTTYWYRPHYFSYRTYVFVPHTTYSYRYSSQVAGGLLLIQEVGGGRYAVDEYLKKRS